MKKTFKPIKKPSVDLFFTFLKRNGAYDSFMRNSSDLGAAYGTVDFSCTTPDYYLSGAFPWVTTREGRDYWKLLDYKWNLVVDLFKF